MEEERPLSEAKSTLSSSEEPTLTELQTSPDETTAARGPSAFLIIGFLVVVGLILTGLFLPPISLGQRLGLGGATSQAAATSIPGQATSAWLVTPGEITLSLSDGATGVNVSALPQADFLNNNAGEVWAAAATAVPTNVTPVTDIYVLDYQGSAPVGQAAVSIPDAADDPQMLDLYGWEGNTWRFIPSQVDSSNQQIVSTEVALPQALMLAHTTAPDEIAIGAEVLPTQELPVEVLPHLTEVMVGTLTLGANGQAQGEIAAMPTGAYDQLIRVTNTGAIVDQVSLSMLLGDSALQSDQIDSLVNMAAAEGYAGLNLDYQGVPADESDEFTGFVGNLADALHAQGLRLALTLATPQEINGRWDTGGQDWAALGQLADVIYVQMPPDPLAYGENGAATQLLEWATRQVNRGKLTPLVTTNAVDRIGESFLELSNDQALANFGQLQLVQGAAEVEPATLIEVALSGTASDLAWDGASLTYQYSYEQADQTHHVWLGNAAALSQRLSLGQQHNLRGVAIRGLGNVAAGGAEYATAIQSYLGAADAPQPAAAAIVWTVRDENGSVVASDSGDALTFSWEGSEEPGSYNILAEFALGDNVATLGDLDIAIATREPEPVVEAREQPEGEGEEPAAEATPAVTTNNNNNTPPAASFSPGDADAVVNTPANIRQGPGLTYGTIANGLAAGTAVSVIGRNADSSWLNITLPDDATEAWIFASLVTVNTALDLNAVQVVEVAPPAGGSSAGSAAPPPVAAPVTNAGFELGGQTHTLANPTLMSYAGMRWVKFQHKWSPGDTADAVAGRIQQAQANGFKVLLSIPGANAYPNSIDFNAYIDFLGGVAALGPNAIEIWNEMNIDFEWPAGQIDPTSYVNNMLAPAYNRIKSVNPNVMVISGAPAPTGFDNGTNAWADNRYMAGVAAAGGANYMDCIGVHHNAGATSPNTAAGHPTGSAHYSWYFLPTLNMYYNAFGGARQVCFTELGYLSGEDFGGVPSRFSWAGGTTVAQHAQWLAEAASLSASSGKVRMLIVFNVDFTVYGDDPQGGYAMIRPGGNCPACEALNQVMGGG